MTNKEYNGWFNYETWAVNLWMDNEEGSQSYWRDLARSYARRDDVYGLSKMIQSEHEEALPDLNGFAADLLNGAMSEVNWYEIAQNLMAEFQEEATQSTTGAHT